MFRIVVIFIAVLIFRQGCAQVDTEFWFAPPEVTAGHGDRPIYLRISTLDKPSVVTVFQPGRGNIQIATAQIAANTTRTIDLSAQIGMLETILSATVMQTGIRITSSTPITAYYEVGASFNSDIFTLKGRNALGNRFVIPGQNLYDNSAQFSPTPSSSFDIVATENNTVVKVYPTRPIFGHPGQSVIVVKLNRGETYSFRKTGLAASDNPMGTRVESNKPIAITIKDDSVINGGCRDILGDQLVPVEVAGMEYVVLKGFLSTPEYLFITAVEDNTDIFIGGAAVPTATLLAGQLYKHLVIEKSTYVTASKTIYVFHVTGFGCEMGMAILPSINCKGSRQIGFSRTTNEFFGLNVLVRKEGIDSFILNASSALIPSTAFTAVPGSSDKWYTAQLSFNTAEIPVGQASMISNNENSFQIGIINGNASSTCRYGYFSAFSTLFIGDDLELCAGDQATLDAGPDKESYQWNTGELTQTISVSTAGEYWVKAEREECILYDTVRVELKTGHLDIGPDREICELDTARIDGKENFSWKWSDGSTGQFLNTTTAGKYWVSVFDYTGCTASDTIIVSLRPLPVIDLGPDILKCASDKVNLDATFPNASYLWQDDIMTPTRVIVNSGAYWVKVNADGCSYIDSLTVEHLPGPSQDSIYGTPSVCPFADQIDYRVDASPGVSYEWFVRGGTLSKQVGNIATVNWLESNSNAYVQALITGPNGCRGDTIDYPVTVNVVLIPEIPMGPDTLCLNKSQAVIYHTPPTHGSTYQWHVAGGEITGGQGSSQIDVSWRAGVNRIGLTETSVTTENLCSGISPELVVYVFKDTTRILLDFVSIDTVDARAINLEWSLNDKRSVLASEVWLYRRNQDALEWQTAATLSADESSFEDFPDFGAGDVFEYFLSLTNFCDEPVNSLVHNNIHLTGTSDTITGSIALQWNHYVGWPGGVARYEVWRKSDTERGFRFLAQVPPDENGFSGNLVADAFKHAYVIRAVEKGGSNDSWSSQLNFEFQHNVVIPNVITPNGDPFNQYFHIEKIELYRDSELTILDRWGKKIFYAKNYRNDWDGTGLSTGVYFYVLNLKKENKIYKGTITIF